MLGIKSKVPRWSPKIKILTGAPENYKKWALKHFTVKPILFNFTNLSTIFSSGLYKSKYECQSCVIYIRNNYETLLPIVFYLSCY